MDSIPDFPSFDHDDAWSLGSQFALEARADGLPITISIDLGEQRVFQASLPGSTAMNVRWAERKANLVRHFDLASIEVAERYGVRENFYVEFGLDQARYAAAEGALPIRVRGSLVGVLAVSGLDEGGDHDLALSALTRFREGRVSA
ncbi:heme-binding protein [Leifsonia sp. fls2-241-R2A-40a]|uniref:heme-binding protein n=1 Tax=Leifsonia sp. fls2-241-R2A-40a TaxID=3040290 RepID=UPI00254E8570|nr:heme-binding protein [Leifsonia sp. fls2-241-R2A-40a]